MFFAEIEDMLSQALDFETFEIILKEVRLKTHYMTDDQRLIWSIFRYLQILFSLDFEDYSKEISKKHLEKKLLLDKFQKEQAVKEDPNKTTPEKDIILEQLEKKYQSDLLVLNTTYQKQYAEWMHNHKQEVHEYIQIKILIEEWLKAHYKT
jgi:hypothetical protein